MLLLGGCGVPFVWGLKCLRFVLWLLVGTLFVVSSVACVCSTGFGVIVITFGIGCWYLLVLYVECSVKFVWFPLRWVIVILLVIE